MSDHSAPRAARLTRRTFLQQAGACAGAVLLPLGAAYALPREMRSLSFVHTHTGEKLLANYCADGVYQTSCLEQVNWLLRDFRSGDVHPIDPKLLDLVYELQRMTDRDATFEIISGYRSPHTNDGLRKKSTGVAKRSLHMEGRAIDIRMTGFSTRKLRDFALSMQRGGVGFYAKSDFLHVDTGRVRSWEG